MLYEFAMRFFFKKKISIAVFVANFSRSEAALLQMFSLFNSRSSEAGLFIELKRTNVDYSYAEIFSAFKYECETLYCIFWKHTLNCMFLCSSNKAHGPRRIRGGVNWYGG